jgi:tetratricopeptide (TPR) repeat protein
VTEDTATHAPAAAASAPRHADLVIARVHLRMGSLGIARAELETLAGRDLLDDEAVRDLAEARWRTGDVTGAGEAAVAYLEINADDVLALTIAAEAQADLGRPAEARRLAGRALERASGSLDPVFAGMPRSNVWPVDADAAAPAGVLFDDLHPGPLPTPPGDGSAAWRWSTDVDDAALDELLETRLPAAMVGGQSLWGDDDLRVAAAALDPTTLFHAGRVALEAGRTEEAATGLILALRAAPSLAPAILDLLGGRAEPILVLVRGDAQRVVGREAEALRDHAAAAGRLTADDGPAMFASPPEPAASSAASPDLGSPLPSASDEPEAETPEPQATLEDT